MSDKFDSMDDFTKAFEAAVKSAEEATYTEALDDCVGILQGFERDMFLRQAGPDNVGWAPLSMWTILRKGHATKLVDTTRLFNSLTAPGTEDTIWMTGDTWLTFGTSVEYSHYHQYGTKDSSGQVRMPARPHVGVDLATAGKIGQRLGDAVAQHLGEQLNG